MRLRVLLFASLLTFSIFSLSQTPAAPTDAEAANSRIAPGFSLDNIDKTVDPCVDFYQYACGNWIKRAVIPPDQSQWVSFVELNERNQTTLRGILEKAAVDAPGRNPIDQKIGDFYSACMDEKAVDAKGLDPVKPELERIA